MAEMSQQVEIPNRALFKAAEVCDLVKVQPYVLRSWEAEFKDLGVTRSGSSARVYRREDIELVLRIKHLLLIDGLTLAGVRRKLEEEAEPPLGEDAPDPAPVGISATARERIVVVKRGLRSLLDMLDAGPGVSSVHPESAPPTDFALAPPAEGAAAARAPKRSASKDRSVASDDAVKSASPRRKRSA